MLPIGGQFEIIGYAAMIMAPAAQNVARNVQALKEPFNETDVFSYCI